MTDAYGNAVPFRVVGDSTLAPTGTIPGTPEARTVTFAPDPSASWRQADIRGEGDGLIGFVNYHVPSSSPATLSYVTRGPSATP